MIIIPYCFVYLGTPRTATHSCHEFLAKLPRAKVFPQRHIFPHDVAYKFQDEEIVSFVRNPLDLIVSWWMWHKHVPQWSDLYTFIKDYRHRTYLPGDSVFMFKKYTDTFLYYEKLGEELSRLLARFNLPFPGTIPILNVTKQKIEDFRSYHTPETIRLMIDLYRDDFERFYPNELDGALER